MPQTYIRTSLPRSGLNSSFSPVSELKILRMDLQPLPDGVRRHELEQLRKFRSMGLAGQSHPQRHEELGALAAGALLQALGERLEVALRLFERFGRGLEEILSGSRHDALLFRSERSQ